MVSNIYDYRLAISFHSDDIVGKALKDDALCSQCSRTAGHWKKRENFFFNKIYCSLDCACKVASQSGTVCLIPGGSLSRFLCGFFEYPYDEH